MLVIIVFQLVKDYRPTLEMPAQSHEHCHKHEIGKRKRHEILPLESEHLVDTYTRERPFEPDDDERYKERLPYKPYDGRYPIHYIVESFPTGDMEGHPSSEEHKGSDTADDKEVEILGEIEEAEMYTGILGVVTCGKLVLSLGKVKH